jgi:phage anti-repressor protein
MLVSTRFNDWIQRNLLSIGFVEGTDFYSYLSKTYEGGRPTKEYVLTLDTAKHISMIQRNEIGKRIRQYFIDFEKKSSQKAPGSTAEFLLQQAQLMVQYEKRINQLESQAAAAHHRIDNFDKLDTIGDLKQRFNRMIRKYAARQGIRFDQAYKNFRQAYNTAYRTNITMRLENYKLKHQISNLSLPEFLERTNSLEDAIRVADKLLNKAG